MNYKIRKMDRIILNQMNDCWSHVMRTVRMVLSVQSITRDLEFVYSPHQRPAGFLTYRSSHKTAFPKLSRQFIQLSFFLSDRAFAHGLVFPAHSDEIVQAFHLFPFYLMSACSHELFHSGSSTGCLFDCYGRYFSILAIIMQ